MKTHQEALSASLDLSATSASLVDMSLGTITLISQADKGVLKQSK